MKERALAQVIVPDVAELPGNGSRYRVVSETGTIVCESAPNVHLHIVPGLCLGPHERKNYPHQSIFLDGVFSGPPFLNNEARQYSLDHHAGDTPRAFMLATCEQAVVMLLEGLPLEDGTWHLYINDPDLDAALAAWVLMNHAPLRIDQGRLLEHAMPLIRVEGVIDAHGTDKMVLSGIPRALYHQCQGILEELRAHEAALKSDGAWESTDQTDYTAKLLERVDEHLLPAKTLAELREIEERGRVDIGPGKLAVLCRSGQGIYSVEVRLKERFGDHLGLIVLDRGHSRYTLRQTDAFLPRNLKAVFAALNDADPNAQDTDVWGGSDDIGGSPRRAGSGLVGDEILKVIKKVFKQRKGFWRRMFGGLGRSAGS